MIKLVDVRPEHKELLWNIHQKYLYEMTKFYPDEMDKAGNYHYGYFDSYFTDPERNALLIYHDSVLIGFAVINPYSYIDADPDYVLAELTIFPAYRKNHFAYDAAECIFRKYKGHWEIKFNENNIAAKNLWNKVTSAYSPTVHCYSDCETVLSFYIQD